MSDDEKAEESSEDKKKRKQELKREYKEAFLLAKNDPSGELLKKARQFDRKIKNGSFKSADDARDWWQNTLEANDWVREQSVASLGSFTAEADPTLKGEVAAQRAEIETDVRDQARNLGVELADDRLSALTEQAWREELGSDDIRELLRDDVTGQLTSSEDNAGFEGNLGNMAAELSDWSAKNGFAIAQEDADRLLASMAFGDMTFDQVKHQMRQTYMAGAYPAWAEMINAGMDIYDLAGPYRSVAQRMLGRSNIAMDDPVMKELMQVQGADGAFSQRPLWDAEREIRGMDEWQTTDDANATYAKGVSAVSSMFGFG